MINKIKEKIEQGIAYKEIAKELNVHPNTVGNYAKKLGLNKKRLSKKEKEDIIKKIKNGEFYSDIAQEYDVSPQAIKQIADKNNISNNRVFKRKHSVNENYFEEIDNERKAYWLGFLTADGCVTYSTEYYKTNNKPNRLQINISNKDINLLKAFCEDIGYDKEKIIVYEPIGTYASNLMCKISINSVKICSDLSKYKIVPNKTSNEEFIILEDDLMSHYIRGFLDGDGTVYKSNNGTHVNFCGSYKYLSDLKQYLQNKNIIENDNSITKYKEKNICYFSFSNKKDIESFKKYMYDTATLFLDRKYNNLI